MNQVKKNFILGIASEAFWGAGLGLILPNTILPLALVDLGQSASSAGLLGSIFSMGICLPQVFSALAVPPRFTNPKSLAWLHFPAIAGPLISGLGFNFLRTGDQGGRLAFLFLGFAVFSFGIGLVAPHWIVCVGRCIPESKRGIYFGSSFFASGLCATLTGWLGSRWAAEGGMDWGYRFCFLFSVLPLLGSVLVLRLLEPIQPEPNQPPPQALWGSFNLLRRKLAEPGSFRMGMVLTILMTLASAPGNLYTVYLREQAHMEASWFQLFTPGVTLGGMAGAFFLGWLVDHHGLQKAFAMAFAAGLASLGLIAFPGHPAGAALAFVFSGFINSAFPVITLVMILRIARREESTVEVGLFNTLMSPWSLAPLFAGWLASTAGYAWAFAAATASCFIAFGLLTKAGNLDQKP